jgi:iron complex transport system substrate-binding protein
MKKDRKNILGEKRQKILKDNQVNCLTMMAEKRKEARFFIPSIAPTWRSPLFFFLFLILVINSILAPLLFGSASFGRELGRPEVKGLVRRITDLAGRQVVIPEQVKTIVALNGSLRYVVYLQAVDLVIGVEGIEKNKNLLNGSNFQSGISGRPYQAAIYDRMGKLPLVGEGGPGKLPDLEILFTLHPDLVLTFEPQVADFVQSRTGLPAVVLSYAGTNGVDFEEIKKSFLFLGQLLGREKRAEELNHFIDQCEKDLRHRTSGVQPATVYIGGISARGAHGLISTEVSYPPLLWITAHNVADELQQKGHVFIDKEKLLSWDPEYIFLDAAGLTLINEDYLKNRSYYEHLSAVRQKKVFTVFPFNFYRTNLEVLISNAYFIGRTLYPEKFSEVEPEKRAAEIIKEFVGADVFTWLKAAYPGFKQVEFSESGIKLK